MEQSSPSSRVGPCTSDSQQRVDNLALVCHRQSQALRLRQLEALLLILQLFASGCFGSFGIRNARYNFRRATRREFQVVPRRDRMVRIFIKEMAIHQIFVVQLQVLCTIFGPGGNFASNDAFVNLFDSVRSKIN